MTGAVSQPSTGHHQQRVSQLAQNRTVSVSNTITTTTAWNVPTAGDKYFPGLNTFRECIFSSRFQILLGCWLSGASPPLNGRIPEQGRGGIWDLCSQDMDVFIKFICFCHFVLRLEEGLDLFVTFLENRKLIGMQDDEFGGWCLPVYWFIDFILLFFPEPSN